MNGGFGGSFIDGFVQAIKDSSDAIFPFLKEILQKFGAISNYGDNAFTYAPLKTDLIVNVWGSEDIFYKSMFGVFYRNYQLVVRSEKDSKLLSRLFNQSSILSDLNRSLLYFNLPIESILKERHVPVMLYP